MNWGIDNPYFSCGWVSPDGHTFCCAWNEHEKLARYLLLHIVNGVHTRRVKKYLLQAGWAMVSKGGDTLTVRMLMPEHRLQLRNSISG